MIKAVLFDFDGVIVKSEEIHRRTFVELMNMEIPSERWFREFAGTGSRKIFRKLLDEKGDEKDVNGLVEERRGMFNGYVEQGKINEMPGLTAFLDLLGEKGIKTAIVSGGHRGYIEKILSMMGISDRFQYVVSADDIPYRKPDPKPFLLAAEELGVKPEECLVVEDSYSGCQAARAAGMKLVWMRPHPAMNAPDCDIAIDDFTDSALAGFMRTVIKSKSA
jgi:HAD superfamily hydrolase (TIGR01509 family)